MKLRSLFVSTIFGICSVTISANAADYSNFSGNVLMELKHDTVSNSSDKISSADKKSDTNLLIEPTFIFGHKEGFKLNNHWKIKPVEDRSYTLYTLNSANYYGSTYYGKEGRHERDLNKPYGLVIEELELIYEKNDIRLGAGKFNPMFGTAFYKSRYHGVYGTDLPVQYKLTEKLGANVAAIFPTTQIELGVFFDDTTGLSDSAINNRGRDKSVGGAGNTDRPESFSLSIEGVDWFGYRGLNYNAGFRYLKTDKAWESNEKGYVLGLEYVYDTSIDSMIIPFIEYARFDNYDGIIGRDTYYTTLSVVGIKGNWNLVVSDTLKREQETGFSDVRDYLIQYSVGYRFENGLMLDLGLRDSKTSTKTNTRTTYKQKAVGAKLSYMMNF